MTSDAGPGRTRPDRAVADAAMLGVPALAGLLAGAQCGIVVVDGDGRYVYANAAASQMLGHSVEQLRDHDLMGGIATGGHVGLLARVAAQLGEHRSPSFTFVMPGADGTEREVVCSTFTIDLAGRPHGVAALWDLSSPRDDARAAVALAQTAAALVGTGTSSEILTGIAHQAVTGTRALSCGISVVGEDHKLASAGAYGPDGPGYGTANPAWIALADTPVESVIEAMTAGSITFAHPAGKATVVPHARHVWETNPITRPFADNLKELDWQAGVYVPLSWENRLIGFFAIFLPSELTEPSPAELAFFTALAGQAALAVMNARMAGDASRAAALRERERLARDLHDSVSQGLFSMTMQARAAQLAMATSGIERGSSLGRSITELAGLTRGALAEMRALIFELRPGALAEEGLVGALRKQVAALAMREQLMMTVDGPKQRVELDEETEVHLYRIVTEALHNAVKHAHAAVVAVEVRAEADALLVTVADDGGGFDPQARYPGHLGLSTMAQRAEAIGAVLTIDSAPGTATAVTVRLPVRPTGSPSGGPPRSHRSS